MLYELEDSRLENPQFVFRAIATAESNAPASTVDIVSTLEALAYVKRLNMIYYGGYLIKIYCPCRFLASRELVIPSYHEVALNFLKHEGSTHGPIEAILTLRNHSPCICWRCCISWRRGTWDSCDDRL